MEAGGFSLTSVTVQIRLVTPVCSASPPSLFGLPW